MAQESNQQERQPCPSWKARPQPGKAPPAPPAGDQLEKCKPEEQGAHEKSEHPCNLEYILFARIIAHCKSSVEVKDLFQLDQPLVGGRTSQVLEVGRHQSLPARVDLLARHAIARRIEAIRRLEVAEQQTIVTQEERVVVPALIG